MIEIVPEYFPLEEEFRRSRVGSGGMMSRRAMSRFVKNPLQVAETIEKIFEDDLHARRVLSLANCVVGTLDAAVLSIHAIGRGYAHATNNNEKHGVKQTDRMIGNTGIDVWLLFHPWAKFVVGGRKEVVVALDWTEFDADDHATLAGYLITSHGRATPLIWMTVRKSTLEGKRNDHEYRLIERLHACLAADVKITLLADRGFGDHPIIQPLIDAALNGGPAGGFLHYRWPRPPQPNQQWSDKLGYVICLPHWAGCSARASTSMTSQRSSRPHSRVTAR